MNSTDPMRVPPRHLLRPADQLDKRQQIDRVERMGDDHTVRYR